ncbi:MAG: RHS repeat protein, partial [Chloroflexi bacterium]|nr:RHS repeat protein [Chloroflexota bacterium]
GNRISVSEHNGREVHYTYDRLNRLTEEYVVDQPNSEERINYTYDSFGNRATKTDSNGTTVYKYEKVLKSSFHNAHIFLVWAIIHKFSPVCYWQLIFTPSVFVPDFYF